jgi:hypothetical protein
MNYTENEDRHKLCGNCNYQRRYGTKQIKKKKRKLQLSEEQQQLTTALHQQKK